jgi:hypothetical protein
MILRSLVLCAVCALWGCTLESSRSGESCKRSTQCAAGLVCVRSKCTKDLGPIADQSTVPDLGMGMGTTAAEGGVAAADGGGTPQAGNASTAGSAAGGGGSGSGS